MRCGLRVGVDVGVSETGGELDEGIPHLRLPTLSNFSSRFNLDRPISVYWSEYFRCVCDPAQ